MYYHFPALDGAYTMNASHNAQYFFGPDMIVAPVTAPAGGKAGESLLNTTAQFLPAWQGCTAAFPDAKYPTHTMQTYLDWRNESARNWWLDVHLGSIINSSVVDGFYWDDPVFGNEGAFIRDGFTPAELADIDKQHAGSTA